MTWDENSLDLVARSAERASLSPLAKLVRSTCSKSSVSTKVLHFSHLAKRQLKRLLRGIALPRWAFCFAIYIFCLVFEQNSSCVAWLLSTSVVQEAERVCSPK